MFTGIIRNTAKITKVEEKDGGLSLSIQKPSDFGSDGDVSIGDSININGVCSTITKLSGNDISFEYIPESLECSNIKTLKVGILVNLEQSLRVSDRLDGHIVQGHVDTTATLESIIAEGNSFVLKLIITDVSLVAPKGAMTLEGISLTVVDVGDDWFTVKIIPHTWKNTNLKEKKEKDALNVEFDILAKYLKQHLLHIT